MSRAPRRIISIDYIALEFAVQFAVQIFVSLERLVKEGSWAAEAVLLWFSFLSKHSTVV